MTLKTKLRLLIAASLLLIGAGIYLSVSYNMLSGVILTIANTILLAINTHSLYTLPK